MNKPFFKKNRNAYYWLNRQGKQERLGADEAEAWTRWAELQAGKPAGLTLEKLVDQYLAWVKKERAPATYTAYNRNLKRWSKNHGSRFITDLKPSDLKDILNLEFKGQSDTSHWMFYKCAVAMFNWGAAEGRELVERTHPLIGKFKKPKCAVRKDCPTQAEFDKLVEACDDQRLRDLIITLWDSGARPHEIFQAEAKHLDRENRRLRYYKAKGDKVKGQKDDAIRTVYLSDRAFELCCRLADQYPTGKLFRNTLGNAWTANLLSARMTVLKNRSGVKATAYGFRHAFCTRAILSKQVDLVTLQELMGHSDLAMISKVYKHLNEATDHLHDSLRKFAG
jgi:integrase